MLKILEEYLLGFILIFILLLFYRSYSKQLPYSYFDEELWIGQSYFLQFYPSSLTNRKVWNTAESSDQPQLVHYVYGIWIYPKFLQQKRSDPNLDYSKYLIQNGFYSSYLSDKYWDYKQNLSNKFVTLGLAERGSYKELADKYGEEVKKNLNLILYVREFNVLLIEFSVCLCFYYLKKIKGLAFTLVFTIIYAVNPQILEYGLLAHSEALFILLFNAAVIYLIKISNKKEKTSDLIMFSLILGLSFSTKLNGIMLYIPFLILEIIKIFDRSKKIDWFGFMSKIIAPLIAAILIFIILNPYTFENPLINIVKMCVQRGETVKDQLALFPNFALHGMADRIYFLVVTVFNSSGSIIVSIISFALFGIGVGLEFKQSLKKESSAKPILVIFISTLIITLAYLQLAWPRYLIHLIIFADYYIVCGIFACFKKISLYNKSI